ncbi:MAG: leucine--tRNA ligase [Planctomycetota bacterium]|jgi:leucyl-tRNA synthetase
MAATQPKEKAGRYDFSTIEARWQAFWAEHNTFKTPEPHENNKPKYYILDMFPYPSGAGLHVGHPIGYCATDIVARFKRMQGYNVLHPMGFDAFGLPAEQYAVSHNVHPAVTTRKNIDNYRRQLQMFGFSYDWDREVATCEPDYYKHTQWMFARMFQSWYDVDMEWTTDDGTRIKGRARPISELVADLDSGKRFVDESLDVVSEPTGDGPAWGELSENDRRRVIDKQRLAFLDEIPVNWCPALGTVLANEEVDADGRSERGSHPVYRRPLKQWMLRITRYADRLLNDLEGLDWPEPIKLKQRNWIGRSTGAELVFPLANHWSIDNGQWTCDGQAQASPIIDQSPHCIKIYTTRPDTLFGATYMVIAPEHPLVNEITTGDQRQSVTDYVNLARNRSDLDRTADTKEKTGVFTGAYAINPVNGQEIPIWVADYVLMGYGTGAIMAVPGGDTRDFEFACSFELPIRCVVKPMEAWIEERLHAMTDNLDTAARESLDAVAHEVPELAEALAQKRAQTEGLTARTLATLKEKVGVARLVEHAVSHPATWGEAFTGEGESVNSPGANGSADVPGGACVLDGLPTSEAKSRIISWLADRRIGRAAVNYKLRDWLFSRQRYWGEPFPVLHSEDGLTVTVADEDLPVELPEMEDFKPTSMPDDSDSLPHPPLSRASEWVNVTRDGKTYTRDLNTMPQWAGSCWYYLRYIDPHNLDRFSSRDAESYWMPIDLYVGGAEHAVLHLLYARFWHKVLFDLGEVSTLEPFSKLFNQGMIQSFAFESARGLVVGPDAVDEVETDQYVLKETGEPVKRRVAKMSKALKNVVNPDEIIAEYGADTFRMYEMYMGPLESEKPWNTRDVPGLARLCHRIWRLIVDEHTGDLSPQLTDEEPDEAALRLLHKTIKRVTEDIELIKLNTAIAAIFEFVNAATAMEKRSRSLMRTFVQLLSPFAPHLGEELWSRLGGSGSMAYEPWPAYDEALARDEEVEVAVQVCGKIKGRITVAADADDEALQAAALADEKVAASIAGKTVRKVIVVKGRLVNIVAT